MRLKRKTLPVADRLRAAMSEILFDDIEEYFFKGCGLAIGNYDRRAVLEGRWHELGSGFQQFMKIVSNTKRPDPNVLKRTLLKYGVVLIDQTKRDKEYGIAFILAQIRGEIIILVNKLNTEEIIDLGKIVPKKNETNNTVLRRISKNTDSFRKTIEMYGEA